ncbi:metallophosphoesterase family protein [Corynebacterium sp. 335C]
MSTAPRPVLILAIADEVREALTVPGAVDVGADRPDVVLSAGDLPFRYVEAVAAAHDAPCAMVPGNHDPSLEGYRPGRLGWHRAGLPATWPGPTGAWAADRDAVEVAGIRVAGLGGCARYRSGPNQWTPSAARRRAARTRRRARRRGEVAGRFADVLLTHSPGVAGGDPDPAHRGLDAVDGLVRDLAPALHLHGHVHPHGRPRRVADEMRDDGRPATLVLNTVGWTLVRLHPAHGGAASWAELVSAGR